MRLQLDTTLLLRSVWGVCAWLWLACLIGCRTPAAVAAVEAPRTWVAFYGSDAPPELLQDYGLVVVDADYRGRVDLLKRNRAQVLAYISVGEVNEQRHYFAVAKARGLLVAENPNWKGAWMVDLRDERWHAMLVDEVAPALLAKGFDGLFLDTVDSALHLEQTEPAKFSGMRQAVVKLITSLHARHPSAALMLNGAVQLAGPLRDQVRMVAVESSLTTWNFETKTARWRTADERAWALARMRQAKTDNPQLAIYTLDYWDPEDRQAQSAVYREQRAQGFIPYVATIALDRVVAEPTARIPSAGIPGAGIPGAVTATAAPLAGQR